MINSFQAEYNRCEEGRVQCRNGQKSRCKNVKKEKVDVVSSSFYEIYMNRDPQSNKCAVGRTLALY